MNTVLRNGRLLLGVSIVAASSAATAQVSVLDYDEASSAYQDAYVTGDFSLQKNRVDDQAAYNLNLGIDYDQVISTPDVDNRFRLNADGNFSRTGEEGAKSGDSYTASASFTTDRYFTPGSNTGFWYGGLTADTSSAFDSVEVRGTVGIGYGRVRNVTPMAEAIRVIDELISRGTLSAAPNRSVYQSIANVIAREDEYYSKFGGRDYLENWIQDVTNVLRDSGLVNNELRTSDVLGVYDVLENERISTRRTGWRVRAGVGGVIRSFDGERDSNPALELGAEYHHPIGNRTQFSNEASLVTVLNDNDNSYSARNLMSLTHEIDDRIDWENSWTLDYIHDGESDTDVTVNTLSSTFIYSLTNSLDFTTTASIANYSGDSNPDNLDGTDKSLFMGVRYRLK